MEITSSTLADYLSPSYYQAFGQKNGLLESLELEQVGTDELAGFHLVNTSICDVRSLIDNDLHHTEAAGKGTVLRDTMHSAFGEMIEHYCIRFPRSETFLRGSYEEVRSRERTIDFDYIDVYDQEFLPDHFEPLDRDRQLPWTEGTNLIDGKPVYVPAELVWFDSGGLADLDSHLPVTTSGAAAGPSVEFAVINSLLEQVERDGVMSAWYRQDSPSGIEISSLSSRWPELHDFLTQEVDTTQLSVRLFDFETPVDLPTVGAVARSRDGSFPGFVYGAGSGMDPREAIYKAATEAIQCFPSVHQYALTMDPDGVSPSTQDNFKSNVFYYTLPENFDEVEMFWEGGTRSVDEFYPPAKYPDAADMSTKEKYARILAKFSDGDVTPIAVDITTRDVERMGAKVTKVVAPELVPLGIPTVPPTNHPRIRDDIETTRPHPFP